MININNIRASHHAHECLLPYPKNHQGPIRHQGCVLTFLGFLVAIDCDKCDSFLEGKKKPDLLVLRKNNNQYEWFVIEIKTQLREKAREQVQSGLNILSNNANLFGDKQAYQLQALFAFTHRNRAADIQSRRPPLRFNGRTVTIKTRKCGTTII